MVKIVIALVLFFLAGGAWLYLDCLNRQELGQTQSLQQDVQQARAEARKRAELKAQFDFQLQSNLQSNLQSSLKSCQDAADKARTNYMALLQKTMPSKRGVVVIPQSSLDEAEAIMAAAKAACQQNYDDRLKQQP